MLNYLRIASWLVTCLLLLSLLVSPSTADVNGAVSPIIGVLAQELYPDSLTVTHFNGTSYIAASYVKFVEGAGGRVVPIWIGRNRSYYEDVIHKINGILLPGGGTWFNETNGYGDAGEHLIEIAKEVNDNGTFFPVWGTCLGMELLVLKMANGTETRSSCQARGMALPLEFKSDHNQSRLFGGASEDLITKLSVENVTYNYHQWCYTEQSFEVPPLNNSWRIISLNHDLNGIEFVSTIEHLRYPFYGVQFHPEKALYEFVSAKVPHTPSAVQSGQYFADFFISEARRNPHVFKNATEQAQSLIYNYKPEYTALVGSSYIQQYVFGEIPEIPDEGEPDDDEPYGSRPDYYPPYYYPNPNRNGAVSISMGFGLIFATVFNLLF
ncbi:gamma-glutamyl hydrolase [Drosophila grimshawi]|uniref:folate gamma-glutamyl hydrolase n=1 Tax=Drosophila grimshawi TaxID=7222 RepID=B4J0B5_DROGR|nr:gamma-glutamyl hydrolase [Drosophila grimshawi]EDV95716.1 GH15860 [Drosophila grimshawi]